MDDQKSLLLNTDSDPEKTGAWEAGCPESTASRLSWKMRRAFLRVVARKQVAVFLLVSFFLLVTYHSTTEIPINGSCPSNRTNPNRVKAPRPPDKEYLTQLWNGLHTSFEAHVPSPSHLPKPKHEQGFPPKEKIGSFFNITDGEAETSRSEHQEVLKALPEYPSGSFKGKGVVMLAGGKYSEFGATSLGMLREVGSKLPVEVWVKDETEEIEGWCEELEKEGMSCRRLADYMDMGVLRHPYQWKVMTVLFSSFSEILFLDGDSMPLKNPDFLFKSDIYKDSGAILWPDYWNHSGSPWAPFITGITDKSDDSLQEEKSVESGQLVWNKEKHWKSLLLATYYNFWGPDFYYTVFNNGYAGWGDKDTFPMGLKAMNEPYFMVPHDIHTAFVSGSVLGVGMLQGNPENATTNEPLFIHSNIIKWSARDFFCEKCEKMPNYKAKPLAHFENPKSPIIKHLQEGKRIFSSLASKEIDPEPLMWKCMEYTACRSVWSNDNMCQKTRNHLEKAFGYTFTPLTGQTAEGVPHNKICIRDPLEFKTE